MAQEIVIKTWCDSHATKDEHEPATQYDVVIRRLGDPFAFVSVDLCEACAKPLGDLLGELVEVGRPFDAATLAQVQAGASKPARKAAAARVVHTSGAQPLTAGKYQCPACEHAYTTKGILQKHVREAHGTTLGELLGESLDFPCEVDGCERAFTTIQGLAVHQNRIHGLASVQRPAPS